MSRHRKYLVWLGIAVGGALLAGVLLVPGDAWVALDQRRSSVRTTPDGVAAWSRSLESLGPVVATRYTSFTAGPLTGQGLVLLEPIQPASAAEVRAVLEWVRAGGVLVYSPGFEALLLDSLSLSLSRRFVGPGSDGPPTRSRLREHRWTDGVEPDSSVATWILEADSARARSWVPLATPRDSAGAAVAWLPEGAGGVLVVAEAEALANGRLASSAQAMVMTRAIVDLLEPSDTLVFSEYHQGLDGRRGVFRESYAIAARSPVGRVLLHAGGISILVLLLSGRAFGSPAPERERDRRSPLEHVEALGRIYQGASSDGSVARRLVHGAVRRSGQRPSGADTEMEILEAWSVRPELRSSARLAIESLRRDPPDLVRLSSALDAIVDEHAPRHQSP